MARAYRVVLAGTDLRLPEAQWEIVDAGELYDDESLAALRDQAHAHGAVLAVLETFNGELAPIVVMCVDAVWNVLEIQGEQHGFLVETRSEGLFCRAGLEHGAWRRRQLFAHRGHPATREHLGSARRGGCFMYPRSPVEAAGMGTGVPGRSSVDAQSRGVALASVVRMERSDTITPK